MSEPVYAPKSRKGLYGVIAVVVIAVVAALAFFGFGGKDAPPQTVNLVAYSTPADAYKLIEAAFQKTDDGKNVTFKESYGPSGDQSRAVEGGQPADFVNFSLDSDVSRLVDAGLVDADWKSAAPHNGVVAHSVVVLVVRKGNPKHITGWDDLIKPGIGIVTPNPASSGGARWNTLAAWGHVIASGGSEADAKAYLTQYFKHAVALPGSARDALTSFTQGNGDVLVSYEDEAILARQKGEEVDYVVPDQTLLIETPAAVTKKSAPVAKTFLDYVFSHDAQQAFLASGFRPVVAGITGTVKGATDPKHPFPTPKTLLTIDKDFGGWSAAKDKFFDDENGIVTKIQIATGTDK